MKIKQYLKDSPVFRLYEASAALTSSLNSQLKKEELSFIQGLVLVTILLDEKNRISPGEISKALGISKTSLSQIISNLEFRGLMKRVIREDDARSLSLSLSNLGLKKANKIVKFLDSFELDLEQKVNIRKEFLSDLFEIKKFFESSNHPKF